MKKNNQKIFRLLFIISIVINVLFVGNEVYNGLRYDLQRQIAKVKEIKQPDSVAYYVGRNEVLKKLPNDADEVIMLGTSLTNSFEWHEIFRTVNIKNRGIDSDISKGILQRLDEIVESKPQKIFIEAGINDIRRHYSMDTVFSNYKKIITTINQKSPDSKVYIQSILPSDKIDNDKIVTFNKSLKRYCDSNNIIYIDLYTSFVSGQKLNPVYDCGDHLHLNGSGYLEWCRLIEDYVNE